MGPDLKRAWAYLRGLFGPDAPEGPDCGGSSTPSTPFSAERTDADWLSAVLNGISDEVYFTDTSGRYTYANPAAMREFGYTSVQGVKVTELVSKLEILRTDGTPRPIEEAPPLRALKGEIVRNEEQLVRIPRLGQFRHRQVSSAPVRGRNGEVIGAVSVVRDVTEARARERDLQEAARRKDEFIAVLAHELRNPLVPIRVGIDLMKRQGEDPQAVARVQPMMERQLQHMTRLIDDLLDVSRISSGKMELQRSLVSISTLIDSAVESHREAIQAGRFQMILGVPEPDVMIEADPTRLAQVIANLVHNATKFTPPGGRIAISADLVREADERARELVITVSDSGSGISAGMLPRVFELFSQDDSSRSGAGGLGIGLALAQQIVQLHGGSIQVRSEGAGLGSTFTVRVPARVSGAAVPRSSPEITALPSGVKAIVVDDNADAADALALLLRQLGVTVQTAYSGTEALTLVRKVPAHVVVLDIGMPDLDGYEVCRRIRAEFSSRIGIIALSGWGQEKDKRASQEAGFDAHLTKPASPAALVEVVNRVVRAG